LHTVVVDLIVQEFCIFDLTQSYSFLYSAIEINRLCTHLMHKINIIDQPIVPGYDMCPTTIRNNE